ncbi:hypothetical protein DSM104299_04670 [Baekduia alba]|uniref:hypothetical protein n=1 Tax=Baekduia alba TaxID=2997333 RepID=UPI0023410396|nr:hypothetical protein [Baekduia alba]WCB95918.1 hypothetical protein DSM104299_04670 [Baekduia alba]
MVLIDQLSPDASLVVDEHAARRTLRSQIARLERDLGETIVAAFPHVREPQGARLSSGPRLLGLGELERVRDDLAERLRAARVVVGARADLEAGSRALLEEMLREPARHKWVRLPAADLGERGCGAYQVRPRLGLIGMLMGWWHVKLSSGCPRPAPA